MGKELANYQLNIISNLLAQQTKLPAKSTHDLFDRGINLSYSQQNENKNEFIEKDSLENTDKNSSSVGQKQTLLSTSLYQSQISIDQQKLINKLNDHLMEKQSNDNPYMLINQVNTSEENVTDLIEYFIIYLLSKINWNRCSSGEINGSPNRYEYCSSLFKSNANYENQPFFEEFYNNNDNLELNSGDFDIDLIKENGPYALQSPNDDDSGEISEKATYDTSTYTNDKVVMVPNNSSKNKIYDFDYFLGY